MAAKWNKTTFKGVRFRNHPTRKHGVQLDKYFNVRFQIKGVKVNEGYGWASEGMTAKKAFLLMSELKEELKIGAGSGLLADRQKAREAAEQRKTQQLKEQARKGIRYKDYFKNIYLPMQDKEKSRNAIRDETSRNDTWIIPAIGKLPIIDVSEFHLKKISSAMRKKGRAEQTIKHVHAALRMVINHAISEKYYHSINPVTVIKRKDKPKINNNRLRFFSHAEAEKFLLLLAAKSREVHNMTLLSLHCGLRAGEIFSLTWKHVDIVHKQVTLTETKSGKDRTIPMTGAVVEMFIGIEQGNRNDLVFPNKKGGKRAWMSKTFERTVEEMGLNDKEADRKDKLVFHSCRHTCASWLVQAGIPLLTVKEILGHSTITLTERYSHLAPDGTRAALNIMEQTLQDSRAGREEKNNRVVAIREVV